jgi:hypothetical protein
MAGKKEQPAAAPAAQGKTEYVALTDIDYPDGPLNYKLATSGQVEKAKYLHLKKGQKSTDLPPEDIPWLLREKFIKAVK